MIYIDASRYSNTAKKTGVENYSFFLINELVEAHRDEVTLISPRKIDLDVKQIVIPFPRLWTLFRLSLEILKNKKMDNLFVPSHVLPLVCPKDTTITIHDVVFKYSPKSYSLASRIYLNWATKSAVRRASKIITPSEATKKDLVEFYKADADKIQVVPLGYQRSSIDFTEEEEQKALKKLGIGKGNYFLYIGRIEHKKNTDTLIKAFTKLAQTNPDIKLVLVGFPGHGGKQILDAIPKDLKSRIVLPGYIGETEKNILLRSCLGFVFPSRHEGFGIPLLEAMDAAVPIIASNIPSSKEVAGENALFFEKEDVQELAKLMERVANSEELRSSQVQKHEEKLRDYQWNLQASKVYSIINTPSARRK